MSGATLKDLTKYHQRAMQYFKNGLVSEQNRLYAQTEEAGAVSFWPVGNSPLEGTVEFLFKETPPASGEKSPTNPSTISGVSSVKVTRANSNLIRWPYYDPSGRKSNGITWTVNADGSISASGTSTASSVFRLQLTDNYPTQAMLIPRGTYHFSGCPSGGGGNTYRFDVAIYTPHFGTRATKTADRGRGGTLVVTEPALCSFYCLVNSGQTLSDLQFKPTLQFDGVDEPFERNEPDVYTLSLNDTYYGGEIDLATGVMTVTHTCIIADSNIGVYPTSTSYCYRFAQQVFPTGNNPSRAACSHFSIANTINFTAMSTNSLCVRLDGMLVFKTNNLSIEEFEDYISAQATNGTPVTVVYPIKEPFTVQLTPLQLTALTQKDKYTPRMNTVYTDADSIQIRYRKSLIHDEDEKVQAIVALGGNV